jgi:3-isopropylmalate/(R)-2-methylmalate dehydratase large subunit
MHMPAAGRTLFDTIWDDHRVNAESTPDGGPDTLYIDLHLIHEVTSPQAFSILRGRGLKLRRPGQTVATMDHSIPSTPPGPDGKYVIEDPDAVIQLAALESNCAEFGVPLFPMGHENQGIVHVTAPELGLIQPGMTIVCGDSHTATHGAFGALAFGIGTSQVAHVFATQCLLAPRPRTFEIRIDGTLQPGVTAKDIILSVIAKIGTEAGTGHVFEYTGTTILAMSMEERMTVTNMSIEGGATAGLIQPDDTAFEYLSGRQYAPQGEAFDEAVSRWRQLATDRSAVFDRSVKIDAGQVEPMITYGTNPGMGMPVRDPVPDPAKLTNRSDRRSAQRALDYMRVEPGKPLLGHPVDVVFVGSCTNSRLSDLRDAARILAGRKVSDKVRMLIVPGSQRTKRAAEDEGLDTIFKAAGAEWREPGCSMCLAMNADKLEPGQLSVSTSNRNFEGRQGPNGRTILASPLTAAACAVTGRVTDVRELL